MITAAVVSDNFVINNYRTWGNTTWESEGVMVEVQDCNLKVSEFECQLQYYVHFRTNTLRKGIKSLIPPAMD